MSWHCIAVAPLPASAASRLGAFRSERDCSPRFGELPSDIHGLVYIPFKKHVSEVKPRLAAELQEAGFQINIKDMLAS